MTTIRQQSLKAFEELEEVKDCTIVAHKSKDGEGIKQLLIIEGNTTYRIYPEYGTLLIAEKA